MKLCNYKLGERGAVRMGMLGIIALFVPACDLAIFTQFFPPAAQDIRAITLVIINESTISVRADAVLKKGDEEVRRTGRFLAPQGRDASVEVLPTVAETLTIEAISTGNEIEHIAPGSILASLTLDIDADFAPGEVVTVIIRLPDILLNRRPVVQLLPEITAPSGALVTIDGSGATDIDGDRLRFIWTQTGGPTVALIGADLQSPTFRAPIVPPDERVPLEFSLSVDDGRFGAATGSTRVLIVGPEKLVVSLPGDLQRIAQNASLALAPAVQGGALPLAYAWTAIQSPNTDPGHFFASDAESTLWTPPLDAIGQWTLGLRVTDAQGNVAAAIVEVSVETDCDANGKIDAVELDTGDADDCNTNSRIDSCDVSSGSSRDLNTNGMPDECDPNEPPVAIIRAPVSVLSRELTMLDGAESSDPDGGALRYEWSQLSGAPVDLGIVDGPMLTFEAPRVPAGLFETLEFRLVVSDDLAAAASTTAVVLVIGPAPLSVTAIGQPTETVPGGVVSLTANVEGGIEPYAFQWNTADAPDGQMGVFSSPDQPQTDWTAPPVNIGVATLRVVVLDSQGNPGAGEVFILLSRDCNTNGQLDSADISDGLSADCNTNTAPDECDIESGTASDCDMNGVLDLCESLTDCDENGTADACETLADCDDNGTPDVCESFLDCDGNGVPDICEGFVDCNTNGVPDGCDFGGKGGSGDCDTNGKPDECDIAEGRLHDCEPNGVPNECEPGWTGSCEMSLCPPVVDCNTNLVDDTCDVILQTSPDCNDNFVPDECDVDDGVSMDCNANQVPDECELEFDCNTNQKPDQCDISSGYSQDCNQNGRPDECEFAGGDCNTNGVLDSCEPPGNDCNTNGMPDECDAVNNDCNDNGIPDVCDAVGNDCNSNGAPDECELEFDCNTNQKPDQCDISAGRSQDCNQNGRPDECDTVNIDCNENGTPDECDAIDNDCNSNGVPDDCDDFRFDCNDNGIPDACDAIGNDCDTNGTPDDCDLGGKNNSDCNTNNVLDVCEIAQDPGIDCNTNTHPDLCDLDSGFSLDCTSNLVPDECDIARGDRDDNSNGIPDICEEQPSCATCQGDVTGDARIDGDDVLAFIPCVLYGGPACGCSDLNGNGMTANTDPEDLVAFINRLLTDSGASCIPP